MTLRKWLGEQKGQVLIFVTLAFVILGMFVGLAVDGGRAYLMRARLSKVVDAAALAGAKAMAGATTLSQAITDATAAACDSAYVNGVTVGECGTGGTKVNISVGNVTNPDGSTQLGVIATGVDSSITFFMRLGSLVGCGEICKNINVIVSGQAAPDTLADVVLVMDDTGTMRQGCNVTQTNSGCPIKGARDGANALVNMLLADPNSHAKIALVPFRGCYANTRNLPVDPAGNNGFPGNGCILFTEIQSLTNNASTLATKINARNAAGGYPGTNACAGMHEGRAQLFGAGSRAIARKVMIVLTDGDNRYSDRANGGSPNLGNPTPNPYPAKPYVTGGGDAGSDPGNCKATTPPGDGTVFGPDFDSAVNSVDSRTNNKATSYKNPDGDKIEIYVLRFAHPPGDSSAATACSPSVVGTGSGRENENENSDRNLSRCIASNTILENPFAISTNDHYFYAAAPEDINTQFQAIAKDILKKRRLVS